jgi:hypothetical protein
MRSRAVLLVVAMLLVAAFAALNWSEIIRPSPLLFGPVVMDAPLGLILLSLLALAIVVFAITAGAIRTASLVESRQHFKSLEAQRTLADKAEASRFTDLRQHLDTQLRELRDRDAIAATEFQRAVVDSQRELRTQLEQINRTLASRLNELEHRIDNRMGHTSGVARTPVVNPVHHDAITPTVQSQQVRDTQVRDAQLREEQIRQQRLRDEQVRSEQEQQARMQQERVQQDIRQDDRPLVGERPAGEQSGWRRWF